MQQILLGEKNKTQTLNYRHKRKINKFKQINQNKSETRNCIGETMKDTNLYSPYKNCTSDQTKRDYWSNVAFQKTTEQLDI